MAGPKPKQPQVGVPKALSLTLPEDLALDLFAFCEAHYGATQTRVIAAALRSFIEAELQSEPSLRRRFNDAKASAQKPPGEVIKLATTDREARGTG